VDLKRLLKRGALIAAGNWQVVVIQFVAQTTFQMLLAVPIVSAAILVAVLLGADLVNLLEGGLRDIFTTIANALMSEPAALAAFVAAFGMVLVGGSVFMFLVKGGTVTVLVAADAAAGPLERDPLTAATLQAASRFTFARFVGGCGHLFRRYLALGLILMAVYGLSAAGYLAFVVVGYRAAGDGSPILAWTFMAASAAAVLVAWITLVNLVYLLLQIVIAAEDLPLVEGFRAVARFVRREFRDLGGIFLVVLAIVIAATFASALAWSGVGLIGFVPLVGLAVIPLQLASLLLRGLAFEFIGVTGLGAYAALYRRHAVHAASAFEPGPVGSGARPLGAWR